MSLCIWCFGFVFCIFFPIMFYYLNILFCNGRKYLFQAKHLNWRTRPGDHIRNPDYHLARSHFTRIFYNFEIILLNLKIVKIIINQSHFPKIFSIFNNRQITQRQLFYFISFYDKHKSPMTNVDSE